MSLPAKREALARIHGRYERAGRPHKTRILDEFCVTCGYHRKAALRLLNHPLPTAPPKRSVGLDRAGLRGVGRAGAGGHGLPQERAGPCGRESLLGMLHARRTEEAVDLCGTDP